MPVTNTGKELLESLMREIELADENAFTPDQEMKEKEREICILPLFLRKMYALRMFYLREAEMLKVTLRYSPKNSDDWKANESAWTKADDMGDLLNELFWTSCKTYANFHSHAVGIRKEWKFVEIAEDDKPKLSFLGGLLGQ